MYASIFITLTEDVKLSTLRINAIIEGHLLMRSFSILWEWLGRAPKLCCWTKFPTYCEMLKFITVLSACIAAAQASFINVGVNKIHSKTANAAAVRGG